MAAGRKQDKAKPKAENRALTVSELTQGLIWYVNAGWELDRIAQSLGVSKARVSDAWRAGKWADARRIARESLAAAAKDYAKGLADVQRQVCEDDLRVGDRLARISDRLIKALDATLEEMDAPDEKGASACEWRLSRLAAAWERVQKARRLAVGLHTDKVATGDDGGQQLREDLFRSIHGSLGAPDSADTPAADASGVVPGSPVDAEHLAAQGS